MRVSRRGLLTGGAAVLASSCGRSPAKAAGPTGPSVDELDRVAGQPVVDFSAVGSPVVIESVRLLKKDSEYFVHVRSKDGAEGSLSVTEGHRLRHRF